MRLSSSRFRLALTVAICCSVFATVVSQQGKVSQSGISEAALKAHVRFLSDDLLEGRGTGARGGELAAKYIAAQLEALGAKGAGPNGSFFQPVSLVGVHTDANTSLTISGASGSETFKFADDFVAYTGAQTEMLDVDADLIFVGYGINAPEQRWNDYKGNHDYRGKILVMLVNDPPATTAEANLFGGRALTYYGRWTYKYEEAARRGAAGAILLHTDQSAGYPWSVVRTSMGTTWRFDIARAEGDTTPFLKLHSWVTDAAARRLMKLAGQERLRLRWRSAAVFPTRLSGHSLIRMMSLRRNPVAEPQITV